MLKISCPNFNIEQIALSGQCFRIKSDGNGRWIVPASGKLLNIQQVAKDECLFNCSQEEYDKFWYDYFDMKTDYSAIKNFVRELNDPFLSAAVDFGYGIRILRQDLWEIIVTFIISQRNNIPRIKKTVARLCEGHENFFPSSSDLKNFSEHDFINLGLGYRAEYVKNIVDAAENGELDLDYLRKLSYNDATNYLKKFKGIGDKVANCIALYGLHKIEAFPVDVWIRRAIDSHYNGKFPLEKAKKFAGIIQQYMFFYQKHALSQF